MKANIKVKKGDKIINEYTIEYDSCKELNALYQEARKVWAEYDVIAETPSYDISYSHTYKEQYFIN
jgi:hypothetical protein